MTDKAGLSSSLAISTRGFKLGSPDAFAKTDTQFANKFKVYDAADPDALFIFGATFDEKLEDEIVVTVIATGFEENAGSNPVPQKKREAPAGQPAAPAPEGDDPYQEIFKIFDRRR